MSTVENIIIQILVKSSPAKCAHGLVAIQKTVGEAQPKGYSKLRINPKIYI